MVEPLQKLRKGAKFFWRADQESSFSRLKATLTSCPLLPYSGADSPAELHTDASGHCLRSVLVRREPTVERLIPYASRTLATSEANCSTTERGG